MKTLNVILDEGIHISGVDCIFLLLLTVLIVLWVITDLVGRRERKKAYEAELIHRGWLNHEEWASEQISRYRQSTHDWNGVPIEVTKSERGEYLWTIPYIDHPGEEK